MVRSGWGELAAWRRGVYTDVLTAVAATADRLARALADADAILAQYDALPRSTPNAERYRILRQAERLLTTTPVAVPPDPPSRFLSDLQSKRRGFASRLENLRKQAQTKETSLNGLLDEVAAPASAHRHRPGRPGSDRPLQDRVVAFGRELLDRAEALRTRSPAGWPPAPPRCADHDKAAPGPDQVRSATEALRAMLGDDVLVVPEYTPPDAIAADLRKAFRDSEAAGRAPHPAAGGTGLPGRRLAARDRPGARHAPAVGAGRAARRRALGAATGCSTPAPDGDDPQLVPGPAAVPRKRPLARHGVRRRTRTTHAHRGPAAVHRALRGPASRATTRSAGCCSTSGPR